MQYFRKYLQTGSGDTAPVKTENIPFVYIKKWVKSDQAIMFRLNNKLIQTNFNDKSQIMLYTQKDILLYSSGQGKDKQIIDLNSPDLKKNSEISRRYQKYYLECNTWRYCWESWPAPVPLRPSTSSNWRSSPSAADIFKLLNDSSLFTISHHTYCLRFIRLFTNPYPPPIPAKRFLMGARLPKKMPAPNPTVHPTAENTLISRTILLSKLSIFLCLPSGVNSSLIIKWYDKWLSDMVKR